MKREKNGFTLAELLIVVAIIAVLVAISIPIFTSQLEKAREAVDLSNIRSAYSIIQTSIMTGNAPDGNAVVEDSAFYIYTSSGTFKRHSYLEPVDDSEVCKLKSKNADLSEYINMDISSPDQTTGWKDYVIVIYYSGINDKPVMYVCPLVWIQKKAQKVRGTVL